MTGRRRERRARTAALVLICAGAALILVLHVVPPTSAIDPITVTISEYGRTSLGWVFAVAVVMIAAGSTSAIVLFVLSRQMRAFSVASGALMLWVLGMLGVAIFPKADWSTGATLDGYVHRAASVVAFVGLAVAIAALIIGDRHASALTRVIPARRLSTQARVAATACVVAASLSIVVLGAYITVSEVRGVAWWTILPLGLLERLLVAVELTGLLTLIAATHTGLGHAAIRERRGEPNRQAPSPAPRP